MEGLKKDHRCVCDMRTSVIGDGCRYCNPQYYIDMLEEQIADSANDTLLKEMAQALEGAINIINDSKGVAGYHLNGDVADWGEFDEINKIVNALKKYQDSLR